MEVKIGEKTFKLEEIRYKDVAELGQLNQVDAAKKLIVLATGINDEEYAQLTMKQGLELQKKINDMNGLTDFQKPQDSETK